MKNKLFGMGFLLTAAVFFAACGGSSSSATPVAEEEGGAGTATVESLASLPTVDLSQYDSSTSASADLAALAQRSLGFSKRLGDNLDALGGFSRAGCECDMNKKEVFRQSQMCQLDRCYVEAMETAGFITIPIITTTPPDSSSYAYYSITPPEVSAEERVARCAGIPAGRTEERAACEAGNEGPGSKGIKLKIGRIGNELQIDMCEGDATLVNNEATYSASGSEYTANVTRIGTFGGKSESSKFGMTVDIGATGTVTNGVVTLGDTGSVSATGQMNGGFGSGAITFERLGSDSSNKIRGAFTGGFTDPFSNTVTSFTSKVYSHFGGASATGCAKFEFTGSMPAMPCAQMLPMGIQDAAQVNSFLQALGAELGMNLLNSEVCASLFFCPNPTFDPANPDPTKKPMIPLPQGGTSCESVTHTGVECFAITNATLTSDTGASEVVQTFTIIAPTASPFYDEVNAFDVSTLSPSIDTIAFTRNWDCQGTFTEINFASFTPEQMAAAQTGMQACQILEERGRNNDGMGGYNCGQSQNMNDINKFAEGGGGQDTFGTYGGELTWVSDTNSTNCDPDLPLKLSLTATNVAEDKYCIARNGECSSEFQITSADTTLTTPIRLNETQRISRITYNGPPPTAANIRIINNAGGPHCRADYNLGRPMFTAEPAACNATTLPPVCQNNPELNTCDRCGTYCMQPGSNCR